MLYQKLLKPVLFKFDPESVHDVFVGLGELLGKSSLLKKAVSAFYGYRGPDISKTVDGLRYETPFILAAGFDCNGRLPGILSQIGLGGVEVGSVTARSCPGNSRPRMRRLPRSGSIIVNKGLRNEGVDRIIEKLKIERLKNLRDKKDFVIGVSIARTNDQKSSNIEEGIADYCYSFRRLNEEDVGDYYTLNISCPNAFCGETFADPELLSRLLSEISKIERGPASPAGRKPVYLKMPINLEWAEFDRLLKVAEKFEIIKGFIIGNLNKDYGYLGGDRDAPSEYRGGLSGRPCAKLSNELIKKTKTVYGNRFTIIGCGGVMSAQDVSDKFAAGADLVQLVTGLIFEGPGLVKNLSKEYSKIYEQK